MTALFRCIDLHVINAVATLCDCHSLSRAHYAGKTIDVIRAEHSQASN